MAEVTNLQPLNFDGIDVPVVEYNGQLYMTAETLGKCLGYEEPRKAVLKIFERHSEEFTSEMQGVVKLTTPGGEQEVRVFSPKGCWLIGMFAKTANAAKFRKWVLDVLEKHIEKKAENTITVLDVQNIVQNAILENNKVVFGILGNQQNLIASLDNKYSDLINNQNQVIANQQSLILNQQQTISADKKEIISVISNQQQMLNVLSTKIDTDNKLIHYLVSKVDSLVNTNTTQKINAKVFPDSDFLTATEIAKKMRI